MKAIDEWRPSKFVMEAGRLRPTRDAGELAVGSRLVAQCMANEYQKAIELHAKGRMLDLGCGKVPLYIAYRVFVDEVICVDWQNSLHNGKHVDFFRDLNQHLDLTGQTFDTILLSDVLEHIRRPERLLGQIHSLLQPCGKLIIGVPFFYHIHEAPNDFFRFTRFALASMLEESGFELCYLEETGGAIEILSDIFGKLTAPLPVMQKAIVAVTCTLCRQRFAQKIANKTRHRFPLGYLVVAQPRSGASTMVTGRKTSREES
jgi:SAM-dependent methyltransferase